MCTLAGTVADGLITHPTSSLPAVLEHIGADVRRGEVAAGRDPGSVAVVASAQFVTGADAAALARHREAKRRSLAFLYSTPAYRSALAAVGLEDRADRLHALSRSQSWEAMADTAMASVLEQLRARL